jgi:quercetin dioxygenase-like cupin family protein
VTDNRREFLTAAMTVVAGSMLGAQQAPAAGGSRAVAQKDAPAVNLEGWVMTATEITLPAGAPPGRKHRHPGFVIGYVIDGQYSFAVNDQPAKTYAAGEMFFESFDAPGQVHSTSGNASSTQPCKFLAIVFTKKGDPVTIPG